MGNVYNAIFQLTVYMYITFVQRVYMYINILYKEEKQETIDSIFGTPLIFINY